MITFSEGKKQSMVMDCKLSKQWLLNYAHDLEDKSLYCCAPAHWPLIVSLVKVKEGQPGKL